MWKMMLAAEICWVHRFSRRGKQMTKDRCINPSEIEEGDLIAYLQGDAPPHVVEHVTLCAFCAEQVEQLRLVDAQLLAAFYRDTCPTTDMLTDFVLGQLPAAEKLRVAAHVRDCSTCSREIASVRDLVDQEPPSLLARLRESLALALAAQPVAHVAAPARGRGWQGRFEAGDLIVSITVQVDKLTGRVRRRGALPQADFTGQSWLLNPEMVTADEEPLYSRIDRRGHFQFSGLKAGVYSLLLQIGKQDVSLETIEVE
jgi:hypothetical protein